jgi:hypothetical protein
MAKAQTPRTPQTLDALRKQWRSDPEFVAEYEALAEEFARAEARITTLAVA